MYEEVFSTTSMKEIIDYSKDEAVAVLKHDRFIATPQGRSKLMNTTVEWYLILKWGNTSESWISLKDLKESHPVKTAGFSKALSIADELSFAWWVWYTLWKRNIIMSKVKARIRKTSHKYGIEIPDSVKNIDNIHRRNNNTFRRDSITKEMTEVGIYFKVLEDGKWRPSAVIKSLAT